MRSPIKLTVVLDYILSNKWKVEAGAGYGKRYCRLYGMATCDSESYSHYCN